MRTLLAAAALSLLSTTTAFAARADDGSATTVSVKVAYGDLDLHTPAGQAALSARITAAARTICTPAPVTGSRLSPAADHQCMIDTRQHAEQTLAARMESDKGTALALVRH